MKSLSAVALFLGLALGACAGASPSADTTPKLDPPADTLSADECGAMADHMATLNADLDRDATVADCSAKVSREEHDCIMAAADQAAVDACMPDADGDGDATPPDGTPPDESPPDESPPDEPDSAQGGEPKGSPRRRPCPHQVGARVSANHAAAPVARPAPAGRSSIGQCSGPSCFAVPATWVVVSSR
jgi:hypothetical protein